MKRALLLWFLISLLAGVLSIILYSRHIGAPVLANDSYQYLDAAAHVASGKCLCTTVAHFDEQVAWGRMPIPFTHFGPGYPIAIAGLKVVGMPGEIGGYILSVAGYLLVICLTWLTCSFLELKPWAIVLICAAWSLNSIALDFGVSVGTDSLFTAILTAIGAIIAYDVRHFDRPRPVLLLAMGALVGSSYWLRQPGLFLVLPLYLYLYWRYALERSVWPYALGAALIAGLLIVPVIIRNLVYTHSWNSGFANGRHTPWREVVVETIKAPYHILFGVQAVARADIWTVIFLLSGVVVVWRAIHRLRHPAQSLLPGTSPTILVWLGVFAVTFAAGILAAEFSTYAASEVRYNFPVFPLVLIGCGVVFQLAGDRIGRTAAALCVASMLMVDARSLLSARTADQSSLPTALLKQQVRPGLPMAKYIQTTLPHDSVLLATEGQAVYYLLKRPVVSLIEPQYSLHTWDEAGIRSVMRSFRADYFLVFPGAGKSLAPEQQATPFLRGLVDGHPPSWLQIAARTPGVILYRCRDCSSGLARAVLPRRVWISGELSLVSADTLTPPKR